MQCIFKTIEENKETGINIHQCELCGYVVKVKQDPKKIHRRCTANVEQLAIQEPGILEKIKSATKAAIDFAADGFKTADADLQEKRRAICHSCEYFDQDKCKKCGCNVPLKTVLASSKCPIDKW